MDDLPRIGAAVLLTDDLYHAVGTINDHYPTKH